MYRRRRSEITEIFLTCEDLEPVLLRYINIIRNKCRTLNGLLDGVSSCVDRKSTRVTTLICRFRDI